MRALIASTLFLVAHTVSAAVTINEVAWMGTVDSSSNEWIELANDGGVADVTGWVLRIEGKKDITLSGSIGAGEYYLIERTDDSTVPGVSADLVASFGTGLSNDGAVLVLFNSAGVEVDRVNGSDAWKIGGETVGNNTTKEPAGRTGSGWATLPETPRAVNGGTPSTPQPTSQSSTAGTSATTSVPPPVVSFPVEPQIFADAGPSSRVVLVGAPSTFSGTAWGIKKEPIDTARFIWGFGDGGTTEGKTVIHTFYYPGEYTAVLDVASGYYAASDRVYVTAITPSFGLRAGGDVAHSFVAIENQTSNEIDLSGWQVSVNGKIFLLPKNTILGSRKTLTLPSEITGLVSPLGVTPELLFPNGFPVKSVGGGALSQHTLEPVKYSPPSTQVLRTTPLLESSQAASVAVASVETSGITLGTDTEKEGMMSWYVGVAFLSALALLAFRASRRRVSKEDDEDTLTADDFDIVEEE